MRKPFIKLPKYPFMSLATVYKTMEIFAKIGVVQVLQW